ncbi:unnamed protein product [Camellia sinensis]
MATEQEISQAFHHSSDDDEEEDEVVEDGEEENSQECKTMFGRCGPRLGTRWSLGRVLDPRATWIREWNRVFLLVCATGLFVDPLFFYALSISDTCMCLFVDGWFAVTVTVLRCMTDALHVWNMWLQLKMTKRSYEVGSGGGEGSRVHNGSARTVALGYLKAKKGFIFDLFVILPIPQSSTMGSYSGLVGKGINNCCDDDILNHVSLPISPQNLPLGLPLASHAKLVWLHIRHCLVGDRPQHDCIFCRIAWAVGACWYLLGIQRAAKCLREQCRETKGCGLRILACEEPIYYGTTSLVRDRARLVWGDNKQARIACLDNEDNFDFGAYKWTVQLVANESRLEKILFPIFWGLMTLSTFVLTTGLLLVTMLIGNIKVFLHATTSKKQAMQLKMRNIEWWMRRRRLPPLFKQRVRNYERQRWAAMRGVDECEMIRNLPEGLRRDIKYHLCLDLVRQVPLFQHMDNLVLENICDRVKSLIFTKGETITREGDPVQRMLFVVRGHLQSSQVLRDGVKSCCMLGPGNFSGDELLSWCLRRPFVERLPPSSSTLLTFETTEAFGLEAEDVKYVTQHFRYTFVNEKVKRSARYYSPGWRTWAAVAIQLAWRRYKHRLTLTSLSFIRPRRPLSRCSSLGEDRLRLYTALLTSPKPNQDDFDF